MQAAVTHYRNVSDSLGFEMAHTTWLDSWANWNLGRWGKMVSNADESVDDALRRNDLFQLIMVTGGMGRAAWLVRDQAGEVERIHSRSLSFDFESQQVQFFHVFEWLASIYELMYEGEYEQGWAKYLELEPEMRKMPFSRLQMLRIVHRSVGTLLALHQHAANTSDRWAARVRLLTHQLRAENKQLKQERELLKKATAFFAKESS